MSKNRKNEPVPIVYHLAAIVIMMVPPILLYLLFKPLLDHLV